MLAGSQSLLGEVLNLLAAALDLLDRAEAPGDIGARVDHARERVREILEPAPIAPRPQREEEAVGRTSGPDLEQRQFEGPQAPFGLGD